MKRVFITGGTNGQLHWELCRSVPAGIEVLKLPSRLDICDSDAVERAMAELRPDVIINAAAYTAVDRAESEPEAAYAVNHLAVGHLASAARDHHAQLVQISTDFVFGADGNRPRQTDEPCAPVNVYGASKLAGEQLVLEQLPDKGLVVRTSWLYSANGNNFVKTMLRLMNEKEELGVVADQIGAPTWARSLAVAVWQAVQRDLTGILHWSGAGVASWYDLAVAIAEEAGELGILSRIPPINALTTEQFPTPASRPAYSLMSLPSSWERLQLQAAHWRVDLRQMLTEVQ